MTTCSFMRPACVLDVHFIILSVCSEENYPEWKPAFIGHWQQKMLLHVLVFHDHVTVNLLLFCYETSATPSKKQIISA